MTGETPAEVYRREQALRVARPTPEHAHGKANGYNNYGCKCDRCAEWAHGHSQKQSARRKQKRHDLALYALPKEPERVEYSLEFIRSLLK